MTAEPEDLDYVAARVHGRYGRMEQLHLQAQGALRGPEALWRVIFPDAPPSTPRALQRQLLVQWWGELQTLARALSGPRARLLEALADRVDVEDRKVLLRGRIGALPRTDVEAELLRPARSGRTRRVPRSIPLAPRTPPPEAPGALPRSLALESALDQRHLERLLAALAGLARGDRRGVRALVHQEVDHYHLLLVARGRFTYGLGPELLLARHVAGAGIGRDRLAAMLGAGDLSAAAAMTVGLALDALPPPAALDAGSLDAAAWHRYLRLARRAFRAGGMGYAAVVGYAGVRLVQVRDLTTLSEGVRLGAAGEAAARLLGTGAGVLRA